MSAYLIYFDLAHFNKIEGEQIAKIIGDRIVKIGERYELGENLYLVKSDKSAVELYPEIAQPYLIHGEETPREFEHIALVITQINVENGNTFGVWSAELWRFLGMFNDANNDNNN